MGGEFEISDFIFQRGLGAFDDVAELAGQLEGLGESGR